MNALTCLTAGYCRSTTKPLTAAPSHWTYWWGIHQRPPFLTPSHHVHSKVLYPPPLNSSLLAVCDNMPRPLSGLGPLVAAGIFPRLGRTRSWAVLLHPHWAGCPWLAAPSPSTPAASTARWRVSRHSASSKHGMRSLQYLTWIYDSITSSLGTNLNLAYGSCNIFKN